MAPRACHGTTRQIQIVISFPQTVHLTTVFSEAILSNFLEPHPGHIGHALTLSIHCQSVTQRYHLRFFNIEK